MFEAERVKVKYRKLASILGSAVLIDENSSQNDLRMLNENPLCFMKQQMSCRNSIKMELS